MARKTNQTRYGISYTHKTTGETLVDVCSSEAGAAAYGDSLEYEGHRYVTLVEVELLPKGKVRVL